MYAHLIHLIDYFNNSQVKYEFDFSDNTVDLEISRARFEGIIYSSLNEVVSFIQTKNQCDLVVFSHFFFSIIIFLILPFYLSYYVILVHCGWLCKNPWDC